MVNFKIEELEKYYDPFHTYRLFKDFKESIFLDSSKEDRELSKFSFIGINPILNFRSQGNSVYINNEKIESNDPFSYLEEIMERFNFKGESHLPFIGGAIGYFSYDIGKIGRAHV